MARYCSSCGKEILIEAAFCPGCGAAVDITQPSLQVNEIIATNTNNIKIGFSDKIDDPSLQAALKKNSKGTLVFAVILILLPVFIAFFIGKSNEDYSSMPIGLLVSSILLVFNLISFAKKKTVKQWDGVVIDKHSRNKLDRDIDDKGSKSYTEYIVSIRDDSGRTRKITEGTSGNSAHPYYEYLNIGDRVRFHPQFNNFYEKYDKTKDTYLFCAVCGKTNDIAEEHCSFCNSLLVK